MGRLFWQDDNLRQQGGRNVSFRVCRSDLFHTGSIYRTVLSAEKKEISGGDPCDGTFYGGMHLCDVRISDKSHDVILLLF